MLWASIRIILAVALAATARAATATVQADVADGEAVSINVLVSGADDSAPSDIESSPLLAVEVPAPSEVKVEVPRLAVWVGAGAQGNYPARSPNANLVNFKAGVEYRFSTPYLALRGGVSANPEALWFDPVSLKLTPFPTWVVRPYVSAGPTLAILDRPYPGLALAGGVDFTIWRHLFLQAEIDGRVVWEMTQVAGTAGIGYAF